MVYSARNRTFSIIALFLTDDHRAKGSGLAPWPARLTTAPPRLADFGTKDMFDKDTVNLKNTLISAFVTLFI